MTTLRLAVGERIPEMPDIVEGAHYNFQASGHLLILSIPNPTSDEIKAVRRGPLELRVLGNDIAFFLLFRFGQIGQGVPWSDARFEWSRVSPENRHVPADDEVITWTIILLDSATQLVQGIRVMTPDSAFQRTIHQAIRRQALRPTLPTRAEADAYIARIERYTSAQLAELAKGAETDQAARDFALVTFVAAMKSFRSGKTNN